MSENRKIHIHYLEGNGLSEGCVVFILFLIIIGGSVMYFAFSKQLVVKSNVEAEGTITSISYTDVISKDGDWYRIYDYILDNETKVSLKISKKNGVQNELEVGDYVYLVNGEFIDGSRLEELRAETAYEEFLSLTVGWVTFLVVIICVVLRFSVWCYESFDIEIIKNPKIKEKKYKGN